MKQLRIVWAEFAQSELEDIYQYYVDNIGALIGENLLNRIIDEVTKQLSNFPKSGAIEHNLVDRVHEYRYLVISNYKIIYRYTSNSVLIVRVFDCRLNPKRMQESIH